MPEPVIGSPISPHEYFPFSIFKFIFKMFSITVDDIPVDWDSIMKQYNFNPLISSFSNTFSMSFLL